jgi:hypothetical protein
MADELDTEWDCKAYNMPCSMDGYTVSCNSQGVQEVLFSLLPSFALSVPCLRFHVQALGLLGRYGQLQAS